MKVKIFTFLAFFAIMSFGTIKAQLWLNENFNYSPPGGPFIASPIASTDNSTANNSANHTPWLTQSSANVVNNTFNLTSGSLTYTGYQATAIGNSLSYVGNTAVGQSLFLPWNHNILQDSTFYISFLVNFASNNASLASPDFFFGIKMAKSATDTNWGACIYAAIDPTQSGHEVNFFIKKSSSGSASYATTNIALNTTHLIVLKYKMGKLAGTSSTTEAGLYDDQMSLFINPTTSSEPGTTTLYNNDAASKDLYRWGTSTVFGGATSVYLRTGSTAGTTPLYTIDAIRVGYTWKDIMAVSTGLSSTTAPDFRYSIDNRKQITVISSDYARYEMVSLSGQKALAGLLKSESNVIDASSLHSGIYILNLHGSNNASAKIIVP
jgi:hypothetical protein